MLLDACGEEQQHGAGRRFLQRLEERVRRLLVEVVRIFHDTDLLRPGPRLDREVRAELADRFDGQFVLVVRRADGEHIGVRARLAPGAGRALVAGFERFRGVFAQQCLGELPGEEVLADARRTDEEIRLPEAAPGERRKTNSGRRRDRGRVPRHGSTFGDRPTVLNERARHFAANRLLNRFDIRRRVDDAVFFNSATRRVADGRRVSLRQRAGQARRGPAVPARRIERNAETLRPVQPEDVLPGDIDANLGAPWIPANAIEAFAAGTLPGRAVSQSRSDTCRRRRCGASTPTSRRAVRGGNVRIRHGSLAAEPGCWNWRST